MEIARIRNRLSAGWLVSATCAVALLHYGQDVLQPVALAVVLSLVIVPLVRVLRSLGMPRRAATIASVALAGGVMLVAAAVLACQLAAAAADLPRYRAALLAKIEQVRSVAVSPIEQWRSNLGVPGARAGAGLDAAATTPPSVQAHDDAAQPVPHLLAIAWRILAQCGIVLVLLVFILLDQDALRDRVLRLAGRSELASAVRVLNDAASGVSRFFLSQFLLNACLGVAVSVALWFLGVPHAALFGALAGVLRFLPYVGILVAGIAIVLFAAAVQPGWTLALQAAGVLAAAELVVANAIEPHVYGRSSGLAPAAIIVSALFWGAVWGPAGLVLSTPLTLCLVVAGRHVRALEPISILFGDSPGITRGQHLYHRALAGELRDAQDEARSFVRRRGFVAYCDQVLLPAVALAAGDHRSGRVQDAQMRSVRATLSGLVDAVAGRSQRTVTPEVVVLCASLPSVRDEFEAGLLASAVTLADLRGASVTLPHAWQERGAESARRIRVAFITCPERTAIDEWRQACRELRARLPHAQLATIRTPLDAGLPAESALRRDVDAVLRTFDEALAFAQGRVAASAPAG